MWTRILGSLFILSVISGCTTTSTMPPSQQALTQTISERTRELLRLNNWTVIGKIAFIQNDKRESASINWQNQGDKNQQRLDLTTFLGINILHLDSKGSTHHIKVDGKEYSSDDLDGLIYQLTGLTLPTEALIYWLKGIPYLTGDQLSYDPVTKLPRNLTSYYDDHLWQIQYDSYQLYGSKRLARKITIKQSELIIKIMLKDWIIK